jgi:hypothetical protein
MGNIEYFPGGQAEVSFIWFRLVSRLNFGGATTPLPLHPHRTHTDNFVLMLCDCVEIFSFSRPGCLTEFASRTGQLRLRPGPNEVGHCIAQGRDSRAANCLRSTP